MSKAGKGSTPSKKRRKLDKSSAPCMQRSMSGKPSESVGVSGNEALLFFVDVQYHYPTTNYFSFRPSDYSEEQVRFQDWGRSLEQSVLGYYHENLKENSKNRVLYGYLSQFGECVVCESFPTIKPIPQPLYSWIDTTKTPAIPISTLTLNDLPRLMMAFHHHIFIKQIRSWDPAEFPVKVELLGDCVEEEMGTYTPYEWQVTTEDAQINDTVLHLDSYLFPESFKNTQPPLAGRLMTILQWGDKDKFNQESVLAKYSGKPDAYSQCNGQIFLLVEINKPPAVLNHAQNVAYLLGGLNVTRAPLLLLATNLKDLWSMYLISQTDSGSPYVAYFEEPDKDPSLICWLIRQAMLASLRYIRKSVSSLRIEPDLDSDGQDSEEDETYYEGRGFKRIIPLKLGLFKKSPIGGGSGAGEAVYDEVGIMKDDPIYAGVVEDVERAMVPEEEFKGSKSEYEKGKQFYQMSAFYQIIYGFKERFPDASPAELAQRYLEEEIKEDEVNVARYEQHEDLAKDRIQMFMEVA